MKLITEITFDGFDTIKEVHDIGPMKDLDELNFITIETVCFELDRDLFWEGSKREFFEWLEGGRIDTKFFDLDRDAVDIDSRFIPIDEFVKFQSLWNETFGEQIKFEFSICF